MTAFTPLAGVTVLDLSRYLPGPLLTRILADLGADVIRIDPPGGDSLRHMPPKRDGVGVSYASLNAGKRSVMIDLKQPEGQAVLRALLPTADVLVEGFRPGVLARLGMDWDALLGEFPRLIGVSLSGYGQSGPDALKAGHDLSYVARSGVLGLFGPSDGPPTVPGTFMADVAGGTYPAAIGVLAALIDRDRTGKGRHLDISLTTSVFAFAAYAMAQAAEGHQEPRGLGALTGGAPCCRCYATSDGRYLAFSALEPNFYDRFCEIAGREDLKGTGYAMGPKGAPVVAAWEAVFASRTLAEWLALIEGEDVCIEPVATPVEAVADPLFAPWVGSADGRPVVHVPVGQQPGEVPETGALREIGADTEAVLAEAGVDEAVVAAARAAGAIGG